MRTGWLTVAAWSLAAIFEGSAAAQDKMPQVQQPAAGEKVCQCGAHPPGPPRDREVKPYAGEPADLSPYAKFSAPYDLNYTHPNIYSGAARDIPEPKGLSEIRIGFLGPIENNSESVLGLRMLHGAQMAVEEANARGGYGGKPFKLIPHNDYNNWQSKAVYGDQRPTDAAIWGAASDQAVKMVYDEKDWAIFGSINAESTHIALRLALRAEIPIVNSANTDATVPETYIPWYFGTMQDDREQDYTLARRIYTQLGLKRVALLRVNNRYGRFGVTKFMDASRRLGHPVVMEQIFFLGDTDFSKELRVIRSARADAIVLWADEPEAAAILKQLRAAGMKQRVFGQFRTLGDRLLAQAGDAAEGFEAVYPYDPTRNDPAWLNFNARYQERFHEKPEQFASMAFDTMNALLDAICQAGLNRARIHDALADLDHYDGVTGRMVFDPNLKNVAPLYLGTVHNGAITYRLATMGKQPMVALAPAGSPAAQTQPSTPPSASPYANLAEQDPSYAGPHAGDLPQGPLSVIVFGPGAAQVVASLQSQAAAQANPSGRPWRLLPVESSQNWGAASSGLVQALFDEHPLAIIALDRDTSHLAEQLSLKTFVPVVALSSDRALTSTNIPWIFRLPVDTTPAAALQLIMAAEPRSGPNPEQLRDVLASGSSITGIAFSAAGEARLP